MLCGGRIPDDDQLFRHCIAPNAFKGSAFAPSKFLYLKRDNQLLHASLAWERYVPTDEYIHAHGCRIARGMTARNIAKGKIEEKDRYIYCGAYQLRAKAIRALAGAENLEEVLYADVAHQIEEGEIAHSDLRIAIDTGAQANIEGTKTAVVDRLWHSSHGPLTHICDCDKQAQPHPSLRLLEAPAGAYADTRSRTARIFSLIRFYVCSWLVRYVPRLVGRPV